MKSQAKFYKHRLPFFVTVIVVTAFAAITTSLLITSKAATLFQTSWVANSYPGGDASNPSSKWVQITVAGMAVDSSGNVVTDSIWDEGTREAGVYKDGQVLARMENLHGWSRTGGTAAATDGTYSYIAMKQDPGDGQGQYLPNGVGWYMVRRYNQNTGLAAPFSGGKGYDGSMLPVSTSARVVGLALNGNEMYVATKEDNTIRVFSKTSFSLLRSWTVNGVNKIAVDSSNTVWAIAGNSIKKYSSAGTDQGTISSVAKPSAIAIDNQGRVMVGDDGPHQQIFYFNASTLAAAGTLGDDGGMFAAPKGVPGPLRFNGITGLGTDSSGNIYVSMDLMGSNSDNGNGDLLGGGAVIRSLTPQGQQRWQLLGLAFVDGGAIDPTNENVMYTARDKFTLDLSKPAGQQWTWAAHTVDRFANPSDNRLVANFKAVSPTVHVIGGQKFLATTGMYTDTLSVYKFSGEIAVPAKNFSLGGGAWAVDIAGNGDVWMANAGANTIQRYPFQSIDGSGNPVYGNVINASLPAPFTSAERLVYESATDSMYISGFTAAAPSPSDAWGTVGKVMARYDNWSGGKNKVWQVDLPYVWVGNVGDRQFIKAFDVEGDYVFALNFNRNSDGTGPSLLVYNTSNGALANTFNPGPEVNSWAGWTDVPHAVSAYKRANGEYNVLTEEDGSGKVLFYRINAPASTPPPNPPPPPASDTTPPSVTIISPQNNATISGTYQISATATDNAGISKVDFYIDGQMVSSDTTAPYSYDWATTTAANGSHALTAKVYDTSQNPGQTVSATNVTVNNAPAQPVTIPFRLNSGGPAITLSGVNWAADNYNVGGDIFSVTNPIASTTDDQIYQDERWGSTFQYVIPVVNGTYKVRLHFAEIFFTASGQRIFNVAAEGQQILTGYDNFASVGANAADIKEATVTVSDGVLNLNFTSNVDEAKISAIEVLPNNTPPIADTTKPVLTVTYPNLSSVPTDGAILQTVSQITFNVTATDNSGSIKSLQATINGQSVTISGNQFKTPNTNGNYTVSITASDNANNIANQQIILKVRYPDFNRDHKVDLLDLSLLMHSWDTNVTEYDINDNQKVDLYDLSFLMRYWGATNL